MELIVKMLRNIRFYFGFLAILILVMYFSRSQAFSFRWFPARLATENLIIGEMHYIQKNDIRDLILGISYANISYGKDKGSSSASKISVTDIDSLLKLAEDMERTASVSVDQLLANSSNRQQVLNTHMKSIRTLISQGQTILPGLDAFMTNTQLEYNACKANKDQADYNFALGVNQNNGSLAEGGYDNAQEHGACETQKRIILNAYGPITAKINKYLSILNDQYNFMEQHFDTLISSYDLFEPGVLEELQSVRDSLQ